MLKEALDRLLKLSRAGVEFATVGALHYAINNGNSPTYNLVSPPLTLPLRLSTMSGLVLLVQRGFNGYTEEEITTSHFLHVVDYNNVRLVALKADDYGQRPTVAEATPTETAKFPFGDYMDAEKFAIALQSRFEPTDDRNVLQSVIGRLTSETVATSEDDGITQTVALKKGAALKTEVTLKPRVTLAPFRTFTEIRQPRSEFIFRLKQFEAEQPPKLALFEADGGAWRVTAMDSIRKYFEENTKVNVVA